MILTLWFPGHWPSLNDLKDAAGTGGGGAGNGYARLKRQWSDGPRLMLRSAIARHKIQPIDQPVMLIYKIQRHTMRGDLGNYGAAADKILSDVLVKEGLLPDDSMRWVRAIMFTFEKSAKADPEGVLLTIAQIENLESDARDRILGSALGQWPESGGEGKPS